MNYPDRVKSLTATLVPAALASWVIWGSLFLWSRNAPGVSLPWGIGGGPGRIRALGLVASNVTMATVNRVTGQCGPDSSPRGRAMLHPDTGRISTPRILCDRIGRHRVLWLQVRYNLYAAPARWGDHADFPIKKVNRTITYWILS